MFDVCSWATFETSFYKIYSFHWQTPAGFLQLLQQLLLKLRSCLLVGCLLLPWIKQVVLKTCHWSYWGTLNLWRVCYPPTHISCSGYNGHACTYSSLHIESIVLCTKSDLTVINTTDSSDKKLQQSACGVTNKHSHLIRPTQLKWIIKLSHRGKQCNDRYKKKAAKNVGRAVTHCAYVR